MTETRDPEPRPSILLVDDDERLRSRMARAFEERGYEVQQAEGYDDAIAIARRESTELAVVDLRMPGKSGLELVRDLHRIDPATKIVVVTGYGSIATALEAVRLGATHYLTKPADVDEIIAAFGRGEARDGGKPRERPRRLRPWPGSSGSTSNACSRTVMATSPRLRKDSGFIVAPCSASSRSTQRPAEPAATICRIQRPEGRP